MDKELCIKVGKWNNSISTEYILIELKIGKWITWRLIYNVHEDWAGVV